MHLQQTPPQVHNELTCCHNYRGDQGEEADQYEPRGGVCCKCKGLRDGGEHKVGKNQEDEEIGGEMCPGCGGEEEILSSILIWADERDELFFASFFLFGSGG